MGLPSIWRAGYHPPVQRHSRWRVRRHHIGTSHARHFLLIPGTLKGRLFPSDCPSFLSRLWHADISHRCFLHGVLGTFWHGTPNHSPGGWRFPGFEWKRMACQVLGPRWQMGRHRSPIWHRIVDLVLFRPQCLCMFSRPLALLP